jgi:hypothetical protein
MAYRSDPTFLTSLRVRNPREAPSPANLNRSHRTKGPALPPWDICPMEYGTLCVPPRARMYATQTRRRLTGRLTVATAVMLCSELAGHFGQTSASTSQGRGTASPWSGSAAAACSAHPAGGPTKSPLTLGPTIESLLRLTETSIRVWDVEDERTGKQFYRYLNTEILAM